MYTPKELALRAAKALDDRKGLKIRLLQVTAHNMVRKTSKWLATYNVSCSAVNQFNHFRC